MPLIELSDVIVELAKIPATAVIGKLQKNEHVIKILKKFDLDPEYPKDEFSHIYAHALVNYGIGKEKALLELFRIDEIKAAFNNAFHNNDLSILVDEGEKVIDWSAVGDKVKTLNIDPRIEFARFNTVFNIVVLKVRKPTQILLEHTLIEGINKILEKLEPVNVLNDIRKELKSNTSIIASIENFDIDITALPSSSPILFGRESECAILDEAWNDDKTNVLSFIASGGVGKSALANSWLKEMRKDNYRGAEIVYGYSFYSQGAKEGKIVSAEPFISTALKWFGEESVENESFDDKARRLAKYFQAKRSLLILDGMEPVQNFKDRRGYVKDRSLKIFLRTLTETFEGLLIVTSRIEIKDLTSYEGTCFKPVDLDNLSPETGEKYLRHLKVQGTSEQLKLAVKEFGGHALALTLLGKFLVIFQEGDITKRSIIPPVEQVPVVAGFEDEHRHACRVIHSFEKNYEGKPELNVMRMMGLFDRPADIGAIDILRKVPLIKGFTDEILNLNDMQWKAALANLREARLLDESEKDKLDCHPLIREHFSAKLKKENPDGWKEANRRLYEYYKNLPEKQYPDTVEEMTPLYSAVHHGCEAGLYQDALDVYWKRILRSEIHYSWKVLGTLGMDLSAISYFFKSLWAVPIEALMKKDKNFVCAQAGHYLRASGRLNDAVQVSGTVLISDIKLRRFEHASQVSNNLSEFHLVLGNVEKAIKYGEISVKYADKSKVESHRLVKRSTFAEALFLSGNINIAEKLFIEAEEIQKRSTPQHKYLYSLRGCQYCDLLLSNGKYKDVLERAENTIKIVEPKNWILDIALDHLSLGRAYLFKTVYEETKDFTISEKHLNKAVEGFRKANYYEYIARGLIARAELYRVLGETMGEKGYFTKAHTDLEEAEETASPEMRLWLTDICLEYARLHFAEGDVEKAKERFQRAEKLIADTGYHRRDQDLAELGKRL